MISRVHDITQEGGARPDRQTGRQCMERREKKGIQGQRGREGIVLSGPGRQAGSDLQGKSWKAVRARRKATLARQDKVIKMKQKWQERVSGRQGRAGSDTRLTARPTRADTAVLVQAGPVKQCRLDRQTV